MNLLSDSWTKTKPDKDDTNTEPWRLVVWETTPGAMTSTTEVNEDNIKSMTRSNVKELEARTTSNQKASFSLPMEAIREEDDAELFGDTIDGANGANDEPDSGDEDAAGGSVPPPPQPWETS